MHVSHSAADMNRRSRSPRRAQEQLRYENPPPQQSGYGQHLGFQRTIQSGRSMPSSTFMIPKPKGKSYAGKLNDV